MACLLRCPKDSLSRAGRTDKRPGHHFESSAAKEARFVDFGQRRLRRLRTEERPLKMHHSAGLWGQR
jgi:hypothetical protein